MKKTLFLFMVLLLGGLLATANASLTDQGSSIYDNDLSSGISFLEDANYAHTRPYVDSYGRSTGFMTYNDSLDFISTLNDSSYLGITSWRMPTLAEMQHLRVVEGVTNSAPHDFDNLGSYYWVQGVGTADMINGTYDIDHYMGAAYRYVLPTHDGEEVPSFSPAPYILYRVFNWQLYHGYGFSLSPLPNSTQFKIFLQANLSNTELENIVSNMNTYGNAVPEPASLLLLGIGLAGVFSMMRRKK